MTVLDFQLFENRAKILHIFDFDGTLVKKSHKFDQDAVKDPQPVKKWFQKFKSLLDTQESDVVVLTARGKERPVRDALRKLGITKRVKIVALGNAQDSAKGEYIKSQFARKYEEIRFYDDNEEYVKKAREIMRDVPVKFIVTQA